MGKRTRERIAVAIGATAAILACGAATPSRPMTVAQRAERAGYIEMFARGYVPGRSGQIFVVPEPGNFFLAREDSAFYRYMHGSPWSYDVDIPLLFWGPPFVASGRSTGRAGLQDVAPTILALLDTPVPTTMTGKVRRDALVDRPGRPAVVLVAVLDGMGRAIWESFEDTLPSLSRLRRQGMWFENARLNYLPSVTSTGHATVSAGTDPRFHGIHGNTTFDRRTHEQVEPFPAMNPASFQVPTLADIWSVVTTGRAVIVAQGATPRAVVSLAGHGACTVNGRPIVMAMFDEKSAGWTTNKSCFRLPEYLAEETAKPRWEAAGGTWMGHPVDTGKRFLRTGFYPAFQIAALQAIVAHEAVGKDSIPDLLLVNFKTPDYVAHLYGPASPEMAAALAALDAELGRLVSTLEAAAGIGHVAIVITADHGMPPEPVPPAADRHYVDDVKATIHQRFDSQAKLILDFDDSNSQMYVDLQRLEELHLTLPEVVRFIEGLDFMRFALTEDEVRAARVR